jgi:small GTP-binding protein
MKKRIIGILAHVDAGKTTLTEAMLYESKVLRKLGRVDHQDAFLDTDALERERGITIYAKQAILPLGDVELTLVDTPGHVDFSAEMERALQVLDYAILVVSGTDGVQGHTQTLWRLLEQYHIPTFLFLNKLDLAGADREGRVAELKKRLGEGCVDVSRPGKDWWEEAAMCDEDLLEHFLSTGTLSDDQIARAVAKRQLFPCFCGAALKLDGVQDLLDGLRRYTQTPQYPAEFGARVYKISRDSQGARLTWLKVTGGVLHVKDTITGPDWAEKADQLRLYSGEKFQMAQEVPAGGVCAVTGLDKTWSGQGLGIDTAAHTPLLEAVLTYQVILPPELDVHQALQKLKILEEEDPQLHIVWNEQLRQVQMLLMGEVQLEILQRRIAERFGMEVQFGTGSIVYKETIADTVEGVGHYEPLRHYAEVHLLLEPGERGSGLTLDTVCPEDVLDRNWQRLIMTHLAEKTHVGVLTGSPLTDVKITLLTGRAHLKHTEGGDFRQATYRAVRQGLMQAQSVLLEPWYDFTLEVPAASVGRAMTDLQQRSATFEGPEHDGDMAILTGTAPVATLRDYPTELAGYTRGQGRLRCTVRGYAPCHNQNAVVARLEYDPERDLENSADSVFCSHGAGHVVKWDQVFDYMHQAAYEEDQPQAEETPLEVLVPPPSRRNRPLTAAEERELEAIFERTYGPIKRPQVYREVKPARHDLDDKPVQLKESPVLDEYLLVDGYNIIFAWDELSRLAQQDLEAARQQLMDRLCSYQGYKKCNVILVFDAYRVKGGHRTVEPYHNITVVYTKEAETADTYIERASFEIGRKHRVRVATSDNIEQIIVMGHGCLRVSARTFHVEVLEVEKAIGEKLEQWRRN